MSATNNRLSEAKSSLRGRILWFWAPALAYVVLIFCVSAQPRLKPPLQFQNADKAAHLVEYGILGWLLGRAVSARRGSTGPATPGLFAIGLGMLVACGDELFQSTVPGRVSSAYDWLADSVGLALAQVLRLALRRG